MKLGDPEWARNWKAAHGAQRTPAPAGSDLARLRQECHRRFDTLWEFGTISRANMYRRLAAAMVIPVAECHFGMFDIASCKRALALRNDPEFLHGIPAAVED